MFGQFENHWKNKIAVFGQFENHCSVQEFSLWAAQFWHLANANFAQNIIWVVWSVLDSLFRLGIPTFSSSVLASCKCLLCSEHNLLKLNNLIIGLYSTQSPSVVHCGKNVYNDIYLLVKASVWLIFDAKKEKDLFLFIYCYYWNHQIYNIWQQFWY